MDLIDIGLHSYTRITTKIRVPPKKLKCKGYLLHYKEVASRTLGAQGVAKLTTTNEVRCLGFVAALNSNTRESALRA